MLLRRRLHWKLDVTASQAAVAIGVLVEVLLVIAFGVIELNVLADFRGNSVLTTLLLRERLFVDFCRTGSNLMLRGCCRVDGATVLGTDIVTLSETLCRIVCFPEHPEQALERHYFRIEYNEHHFSVARLPAADFIVSRVRRSATGITDRGGIHTFEAPEQPFSAPETAKSKDDRLVAVRERPLQRRTEHIVNTSRSFEWLWFIAPFQGIFRFDYPEGRWILT